LSPANVRLSAKEVLKHPWLIEHTKTQVDFDISEIFLKKLKTFTSVTKMQQIALNMIAHQCNTDEIDEVKQIFMKLDVNNDGFITLKELKEVL